MKPSNSKQPLELRDRGGTQQEKETRGATSAKESAGHNSRRDTSEEDRQPTEVSSDYEHDWTSDEDTPDTWETLMDTKDAQAKPCPNKEKGKTSQDPQTDKGKPQSNRLDRQEQRVHQVNHQEESATDQDPQSRGSVTAQMLRKLTKIDKSLMKTLMTLAVQDRGSEHLLDKILTDFTRLKSVALEATHEIARLEGALSNEQRESSSGPSYAEAAARGRSKTSEENASTEFFQREHMETDERKTKLAVIVTSNKMSTDQIQEVIRKKVDPHELGIHEPEMRPGKNGVVITATSKTGLKNLETYIVNDPELGSKMQIQQPKLKRPEVKVIGIEENLTPQDITRKIISQNGLNCSEEDVKITDTWTGKQGKTAIVSLGRKAWVQLHQKSHVNIGWSRCPTFDNTFVPRCTYCSKYGHTQRWCQAKSPKCTECGGKHHFRECRSGEYECVACIEEGVDSDRTNHSMMSRVCPTYQEKKEQERAKILRQLELAEG
ncbi:hypothetical protein HPB52_001755 [Rhipicephalus sanguineus]|uniref:Gag-like protein n=1 Tax=Rhipicephalus sanguineus TaxID=34632 RepID=A0A9D4QGL8_RHISA|nr:hypothetical protein HPB52_001755 [Rhipicephalus sanguineus]